MRRDGVLSTQRKFLDQRQAVAGAAAPRWYREMSRGDWYLAICTAVILAVVVPWTRFQNHAHWQSVAWVPFLSPEVSAADVAANIFLYMPWGFAFVRRFRSG